MLAKINIESSYQNININFKKSIIFLNFKVTVKSTRSPNCRQHAKPYSFMTMLFLMRTGNIIL